MDESQSWVTVAEIIANKTDWTTLLVAIAAGLTGAFGNFWVWSRQAAADRRSVRASLLAEVGSMLKVIEKRGFLEVLTARHEKALMHGSRLPDSEYALPGVTVRDSYNSVFQANLSRLGALSPGEAFKVVRFHHLLECLGADLGEGGAMRSGSGDPDLWSEGIEILNEAIKIGEQLTSKRPWYKRLWTKCGR